MAHAGGCPTKLTDEAMEKAKSYVIDFTPDDNELLPTVAGLAELLCVSKKTITNWAGREENAEFLLLFERLMNKQERMLVTGGLGGAYNSVMAKLILTNHGYSDKQEVTGRDGEPLYIPIIKRFDGTMDEDD